MSLDEVAAVIANGAGGMPGFAGSLDGDALDSLSSFVVAFRTSTPSPTAAAPRTSGSDIYAAECAGCHGPSGEGVVAAPLHSMPYTTEDIAAIISNGVKNMPGFADHLSAEEIAEVAAFVFDFESGTTPPVDQPDVTGEGTQPQTVGIEASARADLYRLTCAACHGVDGSGGIASSLVGASLDEEALIEIIATREGVMPGFESSLSSDQIDEIAVFVVGLGGGTASGEPTTSPGDGAPATAQPSDGSSADVAGKDANEDVGTGPSRWGPSSPPLPRSQS
jgi:mono/diheme cytochrome c family protein